MARKFKTAETRPFLQAAIDEMVTSGTVDPMMLCRGIQQAIELFAEGGHHLTKLKLDLGADGIRVDTLTTVARKPKDWTVEGLWFILFQLLVDKMPLRVASLTLGYGLRPMVEYDDSVENGLPLALNTPYDGPKIQGIMTRQMASQEPPLPQNPLGSTSFPR